MARLVTGLAWGRQLSERDKIKGGDQETGWALILGGAIGVWWPLEEELIAVVVEHQARRDQANTPVQEAP